MQVSRQTRLRRILSRSVQPLLERHGFQKNGKLFIIPHPKLAGVLEIQHSKWKQKGDTEFTFNCGVYIPGVIAFWCNQPLDALRTITDCCIHTRIGFLNDGRLNHWWTLRDENNTEHADAEVSHDICRRLESNAIPFLNRFRVPSDAIQFLSKPRARSDSLVFPQSEAYALCLAAIAASFESEPEEAKRLIDTAVAKTRGTPGQETVESVRKRLFE